MASFAELLAEKGAIKYNREGCRRCFAKHECDGGCFVVNWGKSGKKDEIMLERCAFNKEGTKMDLFFLSGLQGLP